MGTIWVLSAPDGSHVDPMNLAIREWFGFVKRQAIALTGKTLCINLIRITAHYIPLLQRNHLTAQKENFSYTQASAIDWGTNKPHTTG